MCSTVSFRLHVLFTDIHLNGRLWDWRWRTFSALHALRLAAVYLGKSAQSSPLPPGSRFLPKPYNKGEVLKACRDMHRGRISSESCMLGPIGYRSLGV
jgi:hypothetical protein